MAISQPFHRTIWSCASRKKPVGKKQGVALPSTGRNSLCPTGLTKQSRVDSTLQVSSPLDPTLSLEDDVLDWAACRVIVREKHIVHGALSSFRSGHVPPDTLDLLKEQATAMMPTQSEGFLPAKRRWLGNFRCGRSIGPSPAFQRTSWLVSSPSATFQHRQFSCRLEMSSRSPFRLRFFWNYPRVGVQSFVSAPDQRSAVSGAVGCSLGASVSKKCLPAAPKAASLKRLWTGSLASVLDVASHVFRSGGHNDATSISKIIHCDSVDFPARVARL